MTIQKAVSVLFVCMGNICRSPTADGVLRQMVRARGLHKMIEVDSAGTHAYHIGDEPDRRSQAHALQRGYDLSSLRARRVADEDFARFDVVLAMDEDNLAALLARCPPAQRGRVALFMQHARRFAAQREVPDPYYGGATGFEQVLDLVEDGCTGLIESILAARDSGS